MGDGTRDLRLENRFGDTTALQRSRMGDHVASVDAWSDLAGRAAAIKANHDTGVLTGTADARGEGIAAGK